MLYRFIITLFIISSLVILDAQAQPFSLAKPRRTKLESQEQVDDEFFSGSSYKYESELNKEQILNFYRDLLKQDGYEQVDPGREDRDIIVASFFKPDSNKTKRIVFSPGIKKGTLRFFLYTGTSKLNYGGSGQRSACSAKGAISMLYTSVKQPTRQPDFMPLFSPVKQLEYMEWRDSNTVSAGYISPADSETAINFYLQEMPSYGWVLSERHNNAGKYTIDEWFPMVAPDSKFVPSSCSGLIEDVPPLKMHGATLRFKRGNEDCVVTAHTFDNTGRVLRKRPDLSGIQKFGKTIIGVMYYK